MAFALLASWECIRRRGDLVYASSTPLTVAVPALAARLVRRRPYVLEVRDLWPDLAVAMGVVTNRFVVGVLRLFERVSYRHASMGVGLAPGVVTAMVERGRLSSDQVVLVPNACDTRGTTPRPGRPRRLLPVADDVVVFGYTGTFGLANGLDAVLDVADELHRRGEQGCALALVGEGKLGEQLRARVESDQLDNVVFVDLADKSTYADLLSELDVGLPDPRPHPRVRLWHVAAEVLRVPRRGPAGHRELRGLDDRHRHRRRLWVRCAVSRPRRLRGCHRDAPRLGRTPTRHG